MRKISLFRAKKAPTKPMNVSITFAFVPRCPESGAHSRSPVLGVPTLRVSKSGHGLNTSWGEFSMN